MLRSRLFLGIDRHAGIDVGEEGDKVPFPCAFNANGHPSTFLRAHVACYCTVHAPEGWTPAGEGSCPPSNCQPRFVLTLVKRADLSVPIRLGRATRWRASAVRSLVESGAERGDRW